MSEDKFLIDERTTFDKYKEAIKAKARDDKIKKCYLTRQTLSNEFHKSVEELNAGKPVTAFFRYQRVMNSIQQEFFTSNKDFVKELIDKGESVSYNKKLEEYFRTKQEQYKKQKADSSYKRSQLEEESQQRQLRLQADARASSIRKNLAMCTSPTGAPPVLQASEVSFKVNHPITIRYEASSAQWAMRKGDTNRRGLVNLGNTCYMNSVLQALNQTAVSRLFVSDAILSLLSQRDIRSCRLANAFRKVIRGLNDPNYSSAFSPSILKEAIGDVYEPFRGYQQQDANEFLHVLLDGLHNGLNSKKSSSSAVQIDNSKGRDEELAGAFMDNYSRKNSSEIINLFGFQERTAVMCPYCSQIYRSFNISTGIEVPIGKREPVTVEDCLATYCKEEKLDKDSLYSCEKCKRKVQASQQLTLYSTPLILIITLKRFGVQSSDCSTKITTNVAFQQDLDLTPFMCSSRPNSRNVYRLVAIVNHSGSLNGGHYTADVLGGDGGWSSISDEVVTSATKPNFSLAYMLFYEKMHQNQL